MAGAAGQVAKPAEHESWHTWFTQSCPAPQTLPQVPQLFPSFTRLAQYLTPPAAVHEVVPVEHVTVQAPLTQREPSLQVAPHAPQFFSSDLRSRQLSLQLVSPS